MDNYQFYFTIPVNNMYGGVGIYIRKDLTDVCMMDELKIEKTCHCPSCEMESLYLKFTYHKKKFIVGGIYRHPNVNVKHHFISDLETALDKIPEEITVILAGDINIDIIKYDNAETLQYLTTLLSNRFLPYITLPPRITEYSATCIDHMFIKVSNRDRILYENTLAGILYSDILDETFLMREIMPSLSSLT